MSRSSLLALVLLLGFTAGAFAAEISGRWTGIVSTPNGDWQLVYDFQANGEALTGALSTPNGAIPLTDGRIDGDNISFTMMFGGNPVAYTGSVTGDTLVLRSEWGGQERELRLTRAAKP